MVNNDDKDVRDALFENFLSPVQQANLTRYIMGTGDSAGEAAVKLGYIHLSTLKTVRDVMRKGYTIFDVLKIVEDTKREMAAMEKNLDYIMRLCSGRPSNQSRESDIRTILNLPQLDPYLNDKARN